MAYTTIPSRYANFCDRQKRTNPVSTTRTRTANEAHDAKRRAKWLGRTSETLRGCPSVGGYASCSSGTSPRWGSSPVVVRGSRSVLLQYKSASEGARCKPTLRTFHHRVIQAAAAAPRSSGCAWAAFKATNSWTRSCASADQRPCTSLPSTEYEQGCCACLGNVLVGAVFASLCAS